MDSGAFPLRSEFPVAIVGAGPVGLTTALALVLLPNSLRCVRSECRPVDRDQGRHHADPHARGLATLRCGWATFCPRPCGSTRSATSSARPTASAMPSSCISCATRPGFPLSSTCRSHDMEPALRDSLEQLAIREGPSPASPHQLHPACGSRHARARHAGWQKDFRRELSPGLRRRTQHGAGAPRRFGRRPLSA